jgi:hypothetical protein
VITLPTDPAPFDASPALIDFGGFLEPGLGGEVQRIDRMGNRFSLAVTMPPMRSTAAGMAFVSRLIRGKTEGVRMEFPLLGFNPGTPGTPRVNGAGQAGRSLIVDGFTAGYSVVEGQWFTHVNNGRYYLYNVDGPVTANGAGQATLPISPMLRVEPADNDLLLFAQPLIEGFVHGEEWRWNMSVQHLLKLEFEVRERA